MGYGKCGLVKAKGKETKEMKEEGGDGCRSFGMKVVMRGLFGERPVCPRRVPEGHFLPETFKDVTGVSIPAPKTAFVDVLAFPTPSKLR
jgi:hypothetical protein